MRLTTKLRMLLVFMVFLAGNCLAETPDCSPAEVLPENTFPTVRLETSMGDIVVELDRKRAPVTANNFLRYVLAKKYDNTIFHRVMPGFVVQGGGYSETLEERELYAPIINESGNGLKNMPMTIAMARFTIRIRRPTNSISTCQRIPRWTPTPAVGVTPCLGR